MAIDEIISTNPNNPRENRSRRSALRALIFTVIALGAGGTVAVMLKSYVERHGTRQVPMGGLVVATMDLPLATTLQPQHLTVAPWPAGALPEGAFADPRELVGRVLLSKLVKNEAVLSSKLLSRDSGSGLAALLPENTRAVAVRVDDVVGVAGFVHPDDHVDVIVTMRPDRGETISRVILQNLRVLAVGQDLQVDDQKRNRAVPVTVATLQVTPEESEMLALATAQGRLLLSLRPWAEKAQVATLGVGPTQLLGPGRQPVSEHAAVSPKGNERPLARVATPPPIRTAMLPPSLAPSLPANDTVEILRGDRFEQRKFENKDRSAGTGD